MKVVVISPALASSISSPSAVVVPNHISPVVLSSQRHGSNRSKRARAGLCSLKLPTSTSSRHPYPAELPSRLSMFSVDVQILNIQILEPSAFHLHFICIPSTAICNENSAIRCPLSAIRKLQSTIQPWIRIQDLIMLFFQQHWQI